MLSRTQRLTNLSSAFAVTRDVRGLHIALTDDVITTGATMTALSELLIRAGAAAVGCGAFAAPCSEPANGRIITNRNSQLFLGNVMITITDAAQAVFPNCLPTRNPHTNPCFVINPGTPNAECGVSYCPPDAVEATDTALPFEQLTAYVDELSAPFLDEAVIDFVTDQLGSQLTLKAPNAKMRKVADDAPLIERVEYVLQSQINPQLAGTAAVFP